MSYISFSYVWFNKLCKNLKGSFFDRVSLLLSQVLIIKFFQTAESIELWIEDKGENGKYGKLLKKVRAITEVFNAPYDKGQGGKENPNRHQLVRKGSTVILPIHKSSAVGSPTWQSFISSTVLIEYSPKHSSDLSFLDWKTKLGYHALKDEIWDQK